MGLRDPAYAWYSRHLSRQLAKGPVPRHVALIMDGNRRWARQMGFDNVSVGHRYGAEHIEHVLGWCAQSGISHVTIFVASAGNLARRASAEIAFLMEVAEHIIAERMARPDNPWRIHLAGQLDLVPESTALALKRAAEATLDRDTGLHLTVAIGYGGRAEVTDAVRSLLLDAARAGISLRELAGTLSEHDIAARLYTSGLPNPDLVIRTSGEQRLSDFLLWQTADSELHFSDVYWPGFRHIDFLRALRSYAQRQRRQARIR
jgi:short-chain Z-isoprenyl diphosphate synthase